MKTRITSSSVKGSTVHIVWYQCPVSKIFQSYSSCATLREARADARELELGK